MRIRGYLLRRLLSYAPLLGLSYSPIEREAGISAIVRVKNEEDWIEPSLLSIQDVVDEMIVVDNGSTDKTPELLHTLEKQLAPKLKLFGMPHLDHCPLSNFAVAQTRYRWVLKWDGDFVARTTGPYSIHNLRRRLFALSPHRHYHIHLTCIELMGDLWHQLPGWTLRDDPHVSTFSPSLQYVRVVRKVPQRELRALTPILRTDPQGLYTFRFEDIKPPLHYQVLYWQEPYFFHIQVKSALRMYLRDCWADWAENAELQKAYVHLEDYALYRAQKVWPVQSLDEAAKTYMRRVCRFLTPYSKNQFGEHAEILKPYLECPKYRLIYRDGEIFSRNDLE